jgi:peptide-methionine (S)-S-oxide reductase
MSQQPDLPRPETALVGRATPIPTAVSHFVSGRPLQGNRPDGVQSILLGMGCFWGAERLLWQLHGVWVTSVGYSGGLTPNPTYEETCTGLTGHTEVVEVVFDPAILTLEALLKTFWESHDPTQGMRQGNDRGTQYRSAIYADAGALTAANATRDMYNAELLAAGRGVVTTEIAPRGDYYLAEAYHQQYLAKNPGGYCNIGGTGITCPSENGG